MQKLKLTIKKVAVQKIGVAYVPAFEDDGDVSLDGNTGTGNLCCG